jgi:hypothetical protein
VTEDSLAGDKVDTRWARNQGLGVICLQGIELLQHSKAPRRVRLLTSDLKKQIENDSSIKNQLVLVDEDNKTRFQSKYAENM